MAVLKLDSWLDCRAITGWHNDWDKCTNCGGKTLPRPIAKCRRENVGTKEGTTEIGQPCDGDGTGPKSWSDMIGSLSYMYV